MPNENEVIKEMKNFAIRVLKGSCEPQETATLPAVLQMLLDLREI